MRELVRLAEVREGRARQSMADLLKSRSSLYEASTANTASEAAAQEAEAVDASSERLSSADNAANSKILYYLLLSQSTLLRDNHPCD